jgi:hypothetical protein
VVGIISTWAVVHGRGPFTGGTPLNNVFSLQLFFLFAATSFMVLAAVVEEHKSDEQRLRGSEKRLYDLNCDLKEQTGLLEAREELLKIFVKNVPAGVAMLGSDMHYLQVSDRWCADHSVEINGVWIPISRAVKSRSASTTKGVPNGDRLQTPDLPGSAHFNR